MNATFIHKISLMLLLVTSINFARAILPSDVNMDHFNLEQNDLEKDLDDFETDKKETVAHYKLQFSDFYSLRTPPQFNEYLHQPSHFEKIPTPPPEA